jgi:type II secretory pathway pseudopilin PulG
MIFPPTEIVAAIIAVLATMIAGSVAGVQSNARRKAVARRKACLSNQRQIGLAFQLYAGDHDGTASDPGELDLRHRALGSVNK